ncbi:MAG TPA: GvpL/GvpF family gas vesicle protein [Longimicrobiales bacterium]
MSDLIYLYGWIPGAGVARIDALRGIAERPVQLVPCGGALAAISRVPADAYGAEQIEARLADMSWLGEHGLAHERVVAALVDQTTVVPARLFTLFSGDAALATECTERGDWIRQTLERLDGLREWDLKVSYDAARMLETIGETSDEVGALDRELAEATPGRRYLLQKRRDDVARGAVRKSVAKLGDDVLDALGSVARDVKRVPPPSNAEPGELPVVLAAALLVAREREAELREKLATESERFANRGVSIACAGPWAAYRFIGS